jgi:hypothetical protein
MAGVGGDVQFGMEMAFWGAALEVEMALPLLLVMAGRQMGMGDMLVLGTAMEVEVDIRSRAGRKIKLHPKVYNQGIECRLWHVQCT